MVSMAASDTHVNEYSEGEPSHASGPGPRSSASGSLDGRWQKTNHDPGTRYQMLCPGHLVFHLHNKLTGVAKSTAHFIALVVVER